LMLRNGSLHGFFIIVCHVIDLQYKLSQEMVHKPIVVPTKDFKVFIYCILCVNLLSTYNLCLLKGIVYRDGCGFKAESIKGLD
jgi:hypothetical protein